MKRLTTLLAFVTLTAATLHAADWPQWRGPQRDSICTETGLLQTWPEQGPPLAFKITGLGKGYSSVAIVADKLFTMGDRDGKQLLLAYDLNTHQELWHCPVGQPWSDGPRCTPTVDANHVFALGAHGDLVCANADSGKILWQKNLPKDFGGKMMSGWGYSESPLIDANQLICTPGASDALLVALDKKTGRTLWKTSAPDIGSRGKDGAGYCSPVLSTAAGIRQYVQITGRGCLGVAANDGRFLWSYNRIANNTANIPTPIVHNNFVFCTTSYGTGAALLELAPTPEGSGVTVHEKYFLKPNTFQNHHGGVILLDGSLYAGNGHNAGNPVCLDFATGNVRWKAPALGKGSAAILYADHRLIFRYDDGLVALLDASPQRCQPISQFTAVADQGPKWAHPVIANGLLFLRDNNSLLVYNLQQPQQPATSEN